jgi:hypothetical protein
LLNLEVLSSNLNGSMKRISISYRDRALDLAPMVITVPIEIPFICGNNNRRILMLESPHLLLEAPSSKKSIHSLSKSLFRHTKSRLFKRLKNMMQSSLSRPRSLGKVKMFKSFRFLRMLSLSLPKRNSLPLDKRRTLLPRVTILLLKRKKSSRLQLTTYLMLQWQSKVSQSQILLN